MRTTKCTHIVNETVKEFLFVQKKQKKEIRECISMETAQECAMFRNEEETKANENTIKEIAKKAGNFEIRADC